NPLMMACQHQLSKGIDVIRKCHESKTETVVVLQNNAGYVRANLKPLIQVNEKKHLSMQHALTWCINLGWHIIKYFV
ncbi:MAG TPA: hypothetical protein VIQ03_09225, partial [Gammaproteobacteria bacterium]